MKPYLIFINAAVICAVLTTGFYDIKFESLDGVLIKTSSYQGKKCVIVVVSANTASVNLVRYLDSIQKANINVQVIAIPTNDFDGSVSVQELRNLKKNLRIVV